MIRDGDYLILYWRKEFAGYVLESCDSLTPFQAWEAETATPARRANRARSVGTSSLRSTQPELVRLRPDTL
jgi:hypothetical protein